MKMLKELKATLSEAAQKEFRNLNRADKFNLLIELKTSISYLNQIILGFKLIGPQRAQRIEKILKRPGLAKRIRPDIFGGLG